MARKPDVKDYYRRSAPTNSHDNYTILTKGDHKFIERKTDENFTRQKHVR